MLAVRQSDGYYSTNFQGVLRVVAVRSRSAVPFTFWRQHYSFVQLGIGRPASRCGCAAAKAKVQVCSNFATFLSFARASFCQIPRRLMTPSTKLMILEG